MPILIFHRRAKILLEHLFIIQDLDVRKSATSGASPSLSNGGAILFDAVQVLIPTMPRTLHPIPSLLFTINFSEQSI